MRIAIIGGHLGPALSVIGALPKNTDIVFIGRKFALEGDSALSLEYKTITSRKIKFYPIITGRLQRKFTKHTIFSLFKFPYGFIQSLFIIKKCHPDIVLGFGGYVSLPISFASFFFKIPVVVHEQTLDAGVSNRIISLFAKKICISWESSRKYYPENKTTLTGNPVRKFQNFPRSGIPLCETNFKIDNEGIPIVYVTGGSLGSHTVNLIIEKYIKKLLGKFIVIHQTGDAQEFRDFDRLQKLKTSLPKELQERYFLTKFIDTSDVGYILQKADLVVGRSGINTMTELIRFKKPSLLIPLSFSGKGEQIKNALFLKSKGVAEVFFQNERKEDFLELITKMFNNINTYQKNTKSMEGLINKKAAQKIVEVILLCLKGQEKTDSPQH